MKISGGTFSQPEDSDYYLYEYMKDSESRRKRIRKSAVHATLDWLSGDVSLGDLVTILSAGPIVVDEGEPGTGNA